MQTVEEIRRENLALLVKEYGGVSRLAEALERSQSQVSQWLNASIDSKSGKRRSISRRSARFIETACNKPFGWMDQRHSQAEESPKHPSPVAPGPEVGEISTVPVVSTTQAGPDREWFELGYPPGFGEDYIDVPARDPHAYALRVSGDSMEPRMHEGEMVLVYPSWEAQPGDEVVVRMKNGEVMVKRLAYLRNGRVGLDSISDGHKRHEREQEEIEFMHPVVGVIRPTAVRRRGSNGGI